MSFIRAFAEQFADTLRSYRLRSDRTAQSLEKALGNALARGTPSTVLDGLDMAAMAAIIDVQAQLTALTMIRNRIKEAKDELR